MDPRIKAISLPPGPAIKPIDMCMRARRRCRYDRTLEYSLMDSAMKLMDDEAASETQAEDPNR